MSAEPSGTRDRLIGLVRRILGSTSDIKDPFPAGTRLSDLGVSSMKMVNHMLAVEVEFDIVIPQHEITPENFHSVDAIAGLVDRTLHAAGAR